MTDMMQFVTVWATPITLAATAVATALLIGVTIIGRIIALIRW